MARLSLKLFVKILLVILGLMFLGPVLIAKLEKFEANRQTHRRDHGKMVEKQVLVEDDSPAGLNPPQKREQLVPTPILGRKQYGAKATLNPGTLGNFEPTPPSNKKQGPGDNGEPVYVSLSLKQKADQSTREFGFNMEASNQIAMDRTIPDTRLDECKYWQYPEGLPSASVIIVFHNEGGSTLLRTVHSVINTSPKHLLKEVVMVDDFSDKEHLKKPLEDELKQFNGLVKLYRNKERQGLIRTRTEGARKSIGDVIIFLDAHCECNRNWLVPLLARIHYDRTIMAVPIIDGIDWNTFRYNPVYGHGMHYRGIFEWGFLYKESQVPEKELKRRAHNSEPYWSPTHAGGLFAMDRKYFFELGGYDPGLLIWGGENFELSFKIWQCGGSIEWVPCSRVGHVYRNHMPYGFGKIDSKIPVIQVNYMRVVEVWLDERFKKFFYTREPSIEGYHIGNISAQVQFKKDHHCKSFEWFMSNIAYEVWDRFPALPPNLHWGEVREAKGSMCWDTMGYQVGREIKLSHCHHFGGSQLLRLNAKGQLSSGERCVELVQGQLQVTVCPTQPTGFWSYDVATKQMKHTNTNKCVQKILPYDLKLKPCNADEDSQTWNIQETRTW